jgi:hypothetical protein
MLLSNFDSGFIAEPADKNTLCELWQKANEAYTRIGPSARSFIEDADIQTISDVPQQKIDKILKRVKLYQPFDSHPTNIYSVRISKLVTPQITLNISRAEKRTHLKKEKMSLDELFDLSFEPAGKTEAITRQILGLNPNGGALLFTSYDEDIRLYHPPQYRQLPINEKDPYSLSFECVCMPVGGGLTFASAYRVSIAGIPRLILNNGIHRMYKLAEAGYEWCPIVVADLNPLELPDTFVDMPKAILLDPNQNPPLLTDFLNKNVVIPLKYFTVLKTVRLNWNFEQYPTVLK